MHKKAEEKENDDAQLDVDEFVEGYLFERFLLSKGGVVFLVVLELFLDSHVVVLLSMHRYQ